MERKRETEVEKETEDEGEKLERGGKEKQKE